MKKGTVWVEVFPTAGAAVQVVVQVEVFSKAEAAAVE
jgi:hypothetical protein